MNSALAILRHFVYNNLEAAGEQDKRPGGANTAARRSEMSDEYGPTFLTVTDDDGNEIVLEFVDALEHNGQVYQAFFPAEVEDAEEDADSGLVILKVLHENGEDLLSTLDSDEELETVYDLFMQTLFDEE